MINTNINIIYFVNVTNSVIYSERVHFGLHQDSKWNIGEDVTRLCNR